MIDSKVAMINPLSKHGYKAVRPSKLLRKENAAAQQTTFSAGLFSRTQKGLTRFALSRREGLAESK